MRKNKTIEVLRQHFKSKMQNEKHTTIVHINDNSGNDIRILTKCGAWYICKASYWGKNFLVKLFVRNKVTVHYPTDSTANALKNKNFYIDYISPEICIEIFNSLEEISNVFVVFEKFIIINGGMFKSKSYAFDTTNAPTKNLFTRKHCKGEYRIFAEFSIEYNNKKITVSISYSTKNNLRGEYEAIVNGSCIEFQETHILITILAYILKTDDAKKQFVKNKLNNNVFNTILEYEKEFRGSINSKKFNI